MLRLEAYYTEVAPEKLTSREAGRKYLEDMLDKYMDKDKDSHKERDMFKLWNALDRKYGVFPKVLPKNYDGNSKALYPDVYKNLEQEEEKEEL